MTATADQVALAARLGIAKGMTVQEIGYDTDTEVAVGEAIVSGTGADAVDDTFDGVVDIAILWWRDGDGDLVDSLVDSMTSLATSGVIWLFTPKFGRDASVEPADIAEGATTCGLRRTTSVTLTQWQGIRMVPR